MAKIWSTIIGITLRAVDSFDSAFLSDVADFGSLVEVVTWVGHTTVVCSSLNEAPKGY